MLFIYRVQIKMRKLRRSLCFFVCCFLLATIVQNFGPFFRGQIYIHTPNGDAKYNFSLELYVEHKRFTNITNSRIQMSEDQIQCILKAIAPNGNLLVWGLGNDSPYWHNSTRGKVIFLEDASPSYIGGTQWYDKIMHLYPYLESYRVHYKTKNVQSFSRYINNKKHWHELDLCDQLPKSVKQTQWDVIIVDAPLGCCKKGPGRYQSIYTSWRLAKEGTHIFIDDYERKIEHQLSLSMFGKPEGVIKRAKRKFSNANEQAHFIIRSKYLSDNDTYGTHSDKIHLQEIDRNIVTNWSLLVTVNYGFIDIFVNWRLHFLKLNISLPVYVIAEDSVVYRKLKGMSHITVQRSEHVFDNQSVSYGTSSYKRLVSARPSYLLYFLERGMNIIYSDIDTVWLKDPRPYFTGNFDIWGQKDAENIMCTGLLAIQSNSKTCSFIREWQRALNRRLSVNQIIFNKLLRKSSLKTKLLNINLFPSGQYYFKQFSEKERSNVIIVHSNWMRGIDKKIYRFKMMNLWMNGTIS